MLLLSKIKNKWNDNIFSLNEWRYFIYIYTKFLVMYMKSLKEIIELLMFNILFKHSKTLLSSTFSKLHPVNFKLSQGPIIP